MLVAEGEAGEWLQLCAEKARRRALFYPALLAAEPVQLLLWA